MGYMVILTGAASAILLAGDLILDIHNPATDAIPSGQRIALAFLSAAAVRSAGFQGVSVSALTPAVQYVVLLLNLSRADSATQNTLCYHDVHRNIPCRHEVRSSKRPEDRLY